MKILDLTRGKYPALYSPNQSLNLSVDYPDMSVFHKDRFPQVFSNGKFAPGTLWSTIPVFLVESSMADEYVVVPGCQCLIRVPEDRWLAPIGKDGFDIDKWTNTKEGNREDPRERRSSDQAINDLLGVYIYTQEEDIIPRRIFVWLDKIWDYAESNSSKSDVTDNARVLLDLVLYHEMAHALMDTELYGVHPSPFFSYANDYPYRFMEEAYANAIALTMSLGEIHRPSSSVSPKQAAFIESFVKRQGAGYSEGWNVYMRDLFKMDQWLGLKVLFNYEFALLLKCYWKSGFPFDIEVYKEVHHQSWLAIKDHFGKWGLIELPGQAIVKGFNKYDSFGAFDKYGLCKVRLDQHPGYLYGYVNEQGKEQIPVEYDYLYSFEDGITIAKKNGRYGAIDLNNQTVIPFNLPYEDVRGFRNGRAAVRDVSGMWGVIDTSGKEIVPCTSDTIV